VIEAVRFCGFVALVGGVLLALLGVLGGSPEPLDFGVLRPLRADREGRQRVGT
jgi:hypothetical protein